MKLSLRTWTLRAAVCFCLSLAPAVAFPAVKTYQVTGPIIEVDDTSITVQKDKEKWQIARDKDTKVTGELKPGTKVTIQYRMSAASVEAKGGDAKTAPAAKEEPKKDKAAAKK